MTVCVDRKREVLCLPLSQHLASFKYLLVLFKLSANLGLDKLLFYTVIKTVLPTEYRNALYRKEDKIQICIPENFAVLVRPAKDLNGGNASQRARVGGAAAGTQMHRRRTL